MDHPPIARNQLVNRMPSILIAAFGLIPLWFGYDMAGFLNRDETYLIYWALAISALLFAVAVYLWRTKPKNGASIEFSDHGFTLRILRRFRGEVVYDIVWNELREIQYIEAGYNVRLVAFELTHDGAVRLGLLAKTTRRNASKILVSRSIAVPSAFFEPVGDQVVARMIVAAKSAGFKADNAKSNFYLIATRKRWLISPA